MDIMNDNLTEESFEEIEGLNQYLESLGAGKGTADFEVHNDEEARLWRMARRLKISAESAQEAPRSAFIAGLEERLLARQRALDKKSEQPSVIVRIRSKFAPHRLIQAAALITIIIILSFVGFDQLRPSLSSLPSMVTIVKAYTPLEGLPVLPWAPGDLTFKREATLPKAPTSMTIFKQASNQVTYNDVKELASRFGLQSEVHREGESFIVEDGIQKLVVHRHQEGFYDYRLLLEVSKAEMKPIDNVEAIRFAQVYLEQRGLLNFEYQASIDSSMAVNQDKVQFSVHFSQIIKGLVVENAGVTVKLDETGTIIEVIGRVLNVKSMERYPVISAEEAYHALIRHDQERIFLIEAQQEQYGTITGVLEAHGDPLSVQSPYHPGDYVSVEGMVSATKYEDALGNMLAVHTALIIDTGSSRQTYDLIGPKAAEITEYDRLHLRVWGMVVTGQESLAILVEDYQHSRPEEKFVAFMGTFTIEQYVGQDQLVLVTDNGERYLILSPGGQDKVQMGDYPQFEGLTGVRVLVGGTLTGEYSAQNYPLLILAGFKAGSEIDALEGPDQHLWPRPRVVRINLPQLSGEAIVQNVSLMYYSLPVPIDPINSEVTRDLYFLLPVYRFDGSTMNGESFKIYVQAVRSEYLESSSSR